MGKHERRHTGGNDSYRAIFQCHEPSACGVYLWTRGLHIQSGRTADGIHKFIGQPGHNLGTAMISANASNPEIGGVPFNLKGANLGSDVLSVLDELGDNYFGEHDSNANDSNGQIVPAPQCKSATASQIKSGSFFTELKRRDVYKVAVAYAVVSWLLIQATSILLPTFDAPGWMMKAFVALLGLGFILSVIIAWVFEMTPEGIKRTADISLGEAPDVVRQLEARARQQFIRGYLFALIYAGLGDKAKAID